MNQTKTRSTRLMPMLLLLAMLILSPILAMATEYVGTIRVGNNLRFEKVRVEVKQTDHSHIEIFIHRIKFHKLMPVRVNMAIPNVQKQGHDISTSYTVPTLYGKEYERKTVRNLRGQISDKCMWFRATIGGSEVMFCTDGGEDED